MYPRKLLYLLPAFLISSLLAENANETFLMRGVLDLGNTQSFSLSTTTNTSSTWLKLGQSFQGYTLADFDKETQTLTLTKGDQSIELSLAAAEEISNHNGTIEERMAEAEKIMQMIHFEEMMDKSMTVQMEAVTKMLRQQMAGLSKDGSIDEELLAFQTKAISEMFTEFDWKPIKEGMSQAYAEVFTKDELHSIVNFYSTPAGQASIEKQPEIQAKTAEIMMPMIMQASQSMQQKMMEFYKERAQKKKTTPQ